MLYTSSLLVIHFKYSSVCMSIPNSQTIPSLILPPGQPKVQGFLNRQILDPHPDLWNQSARIALRTLLYFPRASPVAQQVKNPPCDAGDAGHAGSIPGSGSSPGEGSGNPLQYSCLENPMDRGAWQATVQRVPESRT